MKPDRRPVQAFMTAFSFFFGGFCLALTGAYFVSFIFFAPHGTTFIRFLSGSFVGIYLAIFAVSILYGLAWALLVVISNSRMGDGKARHSVSLMPGFRNSLVEADASLPHRIDSAVRYGE